MVPLPPYARRIEWLGNPPGDTTMHYGTDIGPYIDTEVYTPSAMAFKVGFDKTGHAGNSYDYCIRSGYGTTPSTRILLYRNTSLDMIVFDEGNGNHNSVGTGAGPFTVDKIAVTNPDTDSSVIVFASCTSISSATIPPKQRFTRGGGWQLYYLQLWNSSDQLVRSFVPCRILDVGYLWDEVEGKFYGNSGTGDFVLGPDVREGVVPTPLNPFGVGRRQEEIRRVEYLESTGTQWVDTGVAVSDPSTVVIEIDEDVCQPFGFTHQNVTSGTWVARYVTKADATALYAYYKDHSNRYTGTTTETRKTSKYDGSSGYYENGAQIASFTVSVGSDSISNKNWFYGAVYDFNINSVDLRNAKAGKVYSLKISVSGTLVRDFVPVAIGSTGYLLDRVSGRLFGNFGTGSFVLGPDIVPVEYVESDGTQWVDTGVSASNSVKFESRLFFVELASNERPAFGNYLARPVHHGSFIGAAGGRWYSWHGAGTGWYFAGVAVSTWYDVAYVDSTTGGRSATIDGVAYGSSGKTSEVAYNGQRFALFAGGTAGYAAAKMRMGYCRVFADSVLVRDFQPVRVGTEGALYDKVTDTVFMSATSTPLVAGPSLPV